MRRATLFLGLAGAMAAALTTLAQSGYPDVKRPPRVGDGHLPPLRREPPPEPSPDRRDPRPPVQQPGEPRPPILSGDGSEPIVSVADRGPRSSDSVGTAFAIDPDGAWITAQHVVDGCRVVYVNVKGEWLPSNVLTVHSVADVAVVRTRVGAVPLQIAVPTPLTVNQDGFQMGYPQFKPGSTHAKLLGRVRVSRPKRGAPMEVAYAWAEISRSPEFEGTLGGISGGPIVDSNGVAVGVNILESARRGRVTTSSPESMRETLGSARVLPRGGQTASISPDNYGQRADAARGNSAVARVFCAFHSNSVPPRVPRN
jgi:serine protease Do